MWPGMPFQNRWYNTSILSFINDGRVPGARDRGGNDSADARAGRPNRPSAGQRPLHSGAARAGCGGQSQRTGDERGVDAVACPAPPMELQKVRAWQPRGTTRSTGAGSCGERGPWGAGAAIRVGEVETRGNRKGLLFPARWWDSEAWGRAGTGREQSGTERAVLQ